MAAKKPQPGSPPRGRGGVECKPREPWERQKDESAVAYEAFAVYRDSGVDRSIPKVAQKLTKSNGLMKRWSAEHRWVNRAEEWDIEQDRILAKVLERDRVKMRKLHADIARAVLLKGAAQLNKSAPNPKTAQKDAITMIESGMKNERIARSETEDTTSNAARAGSHFVDALIQLAPEVWEDEGEETADDE
jgi:hypothetical protein